MTNQASEAMPHTDNAPGVSKKKRAPGEAVGLLRQLLTRIADRGLAATYYGTSAPEKERVAFRAANASDLHEANELLTDVSIALFGREPGEGVRVVLPEGASPFVDGNGPLIPVQLGVGHHHEDDTATTFSVGGVEWLRIEASGDVFVRGEKVDNNRVIYAAFRGWLDAAVTEEEAFTEAEPEPEAVNDAQVYTRGTMTIREDGKVVSQESVDVAVGSGMGELLKAVGFPGKTGE